MVVRLYLALQMTTKKHSNIFHILLIGTAAVMVWRGAWGLMDLYVFPNDPTLSYVLSLIVGLLILIVTQKLEDELL